MISFLSKLFDENAKAIKRYQGVVERINALEPAMKKLTDSKLGDKTAEFKKRVKKGEPLDQILPEAFAVVREASRRTLGLRHYDVQLIAGMAFHEGKIAEQKTGEGKTLSATLALYLNALSEEGVHLVTVNDYLAQLGAGWMGPIFEMLNVSVSVIVHDENLLYDSKFRSPDRGDDRLEHFRPITRQQAYATDVTYGTNNEFGFDYLRDNLVQKVEDIVQRPFNYAIVDEADSILIDEARTPLIISAPDAEPTKKYYDFAKLVDTLDASDYAVDEKMKTAVLTDLGVKRIETKLGVGNLYEEEFDTIRHVEQALKARTLFHRDKEYIVRDNQVIIVDEHTGRLMYGRRYSDSLHQAIEAKEGVQIQQESRTLATVSLQNYFRLYKKLAGMTGTAATETEEFRKIYNMDVAIMPTHVPVKRIDSADVIFKTTRAKYGAIVKEVEEFHARKQPVLIGTRSIQHNEIIDDYLTRKKIPHQVLNAKNHEREAFIIADAGRPGAITVATNIAGRGVDIVLGGAKPELKDFKNKTEYNRAVVTWEKNHDKVVESGGLHVIGTERHESRRIDNQLRGRAGRQGDAGSSKFFVALEDEIMRLFGGEQISKLMGFLKIEEDQPIEHAMIGKAIEQAQIKVEGFFFDQRKRLVEFDDVMNQQREVIYERRRKILFGERDLRSEIITNLHETITAQVTMRAPENFTDEEYNAIIKEFVTIIPFDDNSQRELKKRISQTHSVDEIIDALTEIADQTYAKREKDLGKTVAHDIEKFVVLSTLDEQWMDHLDNMESLRDGIWLRGDKQTVLSSYKKEAFSMFEGMVNRIDDDVVKRIFRVQPNPQQQQAASLADNAIEIKEEALTGSIAQEAQQAAVAAATPTSTSGSLSDLAQAMSKVKSPVNLAKPGQAKVKIGRNDPCPCGSGKKYKKCHGKNAV